MKSIDLKKFNSLG